ncbi:hypothetical protein CEUSTIGMA_g6824.t1 [Chlamydomonas eustigma]|uniref:Sugar phosphate transporter domain-containing protein n=1 Tax=Chlamydomonas eustigma TaxID=1157962 RepID=A0A250X912_9CHLO|nr:hypothetical protein CEUSTIGMA_g6824.t1 [Chlamydomonas eustigma]|eukprot:GAX79382.1 hypothetical protein CEUSTIGMA_g6824.t1 [Chlamydomonas eustigma]
MCRALLPLFVMISLYITGLELPTSSLIKAVILTCVGCMLAAYGEVNLNVVGLLCLIGNFTFEAGRLVLLQVLLVGHEFHPVQGLKLVGPAILTCLCLSSLVVEVPRMMKHKGIEIVLDNWPVFLVAATLGLCVNLISLLIIKMSGSTTLKVMQAAAVMY